MTVIGIDPGLSGAIAFIERTNDWAIMLEVHDVPVHSIKRGKSAKKELDAHALATIFQARSASHAFVERVGAMPGQGVSSMFAFGKVYGALLACIACFGVPYTLVTPVAWKRAVGVPVGDGGSKDGSRARASQLMPQHAGLWARVKDDGRAEAALIAYYGLLQMQNA